MQIITENLATEFNNFIIGKNIKPVEYNAELSEILKSKEKNAVVLQHQPVENFSFFEIIKAFTKKFSSLLNHTK